MCHQLTPCVAALETVSCVPNVEHDALGLTGRLEDKAAIVRKCALQLLSKLLCYNPFGQFLPLDQMTAVLQQQKAELQARSSTLSQSRCLVRPNMQLAYISRQYPDVGDTSKCALHQKGVIHGDTCQ